jgi:hypothetical protein
MQQINTEEDLIPLVVIPIDLNQGTGVHALWTFQGMISSQTVLTTAPYKQDQITR